MTSKKELEEKLQRDNIAWWNLCPIGQENLYYCQQCKDYIVTIDVDRGTTPMLLSCIATAGCSGPMKSMGYPNPSTKPQFIGPAEWVWFRPESDVLGRFDKNDLVNEHIQKGGLILTSLNKWKEYDKA